MFFFQVDKSEKCWAIPRFVEQIFFQEDEFWSSSGLPTSPSVITALQAITVWL